MKFFFYITLVMTQFFFVFGVESFEDPKENFLYTDQTKYFFGTVKRGEIVKHEFKLENRCSKKIIITEIKTLPNCKLNSSLPIEIMPEQIYDLKLFIDTSGSQGVCKTAVTLLCESPLYYEKTLFISGKIISDIKISPKIVSFDDVFKGSVHKKTLKLSAKNVFIPNIKRIIPSSKFINTVFNSKESSGQQIIIDVILSPEAPLGYIDEEIVITTNEKLDPQRKIKVIAKIVGDVQIEPDNLNFGMVNGKNSEKIINVKPYKGKSLNIKKIVSRKGEVTTRLVTIRQGKEYMVLVKLVEPKNNNSLIDDIIEIHTSSDLQPVIEIDVAGNFTDDYLGVDN